MFEKFPFETNNIMKKYTIPSFIRNSTEEFYNNIALAFVDDKGITYSELGKKIEETVALLQLSGIERGDKIALIGENTPNWGIAYLSVISMGAVAVPVLPDFHENEVQNILTHSESKLLIASNRQIARLKNTIGKTVRVIIADTLTPIDSAPVEPSPPPTVTDMKAMDETSNENDLATII